MSASEPTDAERAAWERDGFFVRRGFAREPTMRRMLARAVDICRRHAAGADVRPALVVPEAKPNPRAREPEDLVSKVFRLHRDPAFGDFARDPRLLDLLAGLVGDDVDLFLSQFITYVEPQQYLTCWVPLTEATEENGCPWIAPGLHRLGTLEHRFVDPLGFECFAEPPRALPAPVRPGDVVVFSSLTPHLTGPNTTSAVRKAYILQYAPEGARKLEGDPHAGPPTGTAPCTDPAWQFPVLRGGERVAPAAAAARAGRPARAGAGPGGAQ